MGARIRIAVGVAAVAIVGAALAAATRGRRGWTGSASSPGGSLVCPYGLDDATTATGGTTVTYDKACLVDGDCTAGVHLIDCCGTAVALGIRSGEAARFARPDGVCGVHAVCKCAGRGVFAEDGNASADPGGLSDVAVACRGGMCTTRIVPGAAHAIPSASPLPSTMASPAPTSTVFDDWLQSVGGGCPMPSPADCRVPSACKPSHCVCRTGTWTCTPDCNGCAAAGLPPLLPSVAGAAPGAGPPMARPECDPPYTWDDAGHKRYKVSCVAP